MPTRLRLPKPPLESPPSSFPVLATLAPVAGALVLWAILQTPMALMFALLGPLIAIASLGDGRLARRRQRRREIARFHEDVAALEQRIDSEIATEASIRSERSPDARRITERAVNDPHRWRWQPGEPFDVVVGHGMVPSSVELEEGDPHPEPTVAAAIGSLRDRARRVRAPVALDARRGLGIVGPTPVAEALARSLVLQLTDLVAPTSGRIVAVGAESWRWLDSLPHPLTRDDGERVLVRFLADGAEATIAIAERAELLPRDCRVVVRAGLDDIDVEGLSCTPVLLSDLEVCRAAERLSAAAEDAGMRAGGGVPDQVLLEDLAQHPAGQLSATFLVAERPVTIDLVEHGPHAVVGGTTGSGKSELLIAWIAALARAYDTTKLAVLLVDFKGGSSFGQLSQLRHCVGVITDLDEHAALRAIESLRAEIRYREQALARLGARDIAEAGGALERLVIVVDELAAMLRAFPDLHKLFADIAARGRSLGMHLILCTQRPAEAVRDGVLANCGLRISLRVTDDADALAVTGTRDAAAIGLDQRGRCVIRIAGGPTQVAQAAYATGALVEQIVASTRSQAAPRRPWRDPLPGVVRLDELRQAPGVPLGLVDRPAVQRIDAIGWSPDTQGPLLALGAAASGKSELARTLAAGGAAVISDEECLWDALAEPIGRGMTVVDDIDLLLARLGDDHALEVAIRLARRMREGAAVGHAVALTARRITSAMGQFAPLADTRVLLRLASRQEHLLAGGSANTFDAALPPGGAWIGGERVQVARSEREPITRTPTRVALPAGPLAAVVASSADLPQGRGPWLPPGSDGDLIAGTPGEWEAAWGALDRLRLERPVLVIGVDERTVRHTLRGAPLPPVHQGQRRWILDRGEFQRLA